MLIIKFPDDYTDNGDIIFDDICGERLGGFSAAVMNRLGTKTSQLLKLEVREASSVRRRGMLWQDRQRPRRIDIRRSRIATRTNATTRHCMLTVDSDFPSAIADKKGLRFINYKQHHILTVCWYLIYIKILSCNEHHFVPFLRVMYNNL